MHTLETIIEIWINLGEHQVTEILDMSNDIRYSGIPVALYHHKWWNVKFCQMNKSGLFVEK